MRKFFYCGLLLLLASLAVAEESYGRPEVSAEERLKASSRLMLDKVFEGLYGAFTQVIPEAKTLSFKEKVMAYQSEIRRLGAGIYSGDPSVMESYSKLTQNFDEELESFLGEDVYEQFKAYQKTLGARTRLLQMQMQDGFYVMDRAVREKLVHLMTEVDATLKIPDTLDKQIEFFHQGMTREKIDEIIELNRKATALYLKRSKDLLSELEWSSLKANLDRAADNLERGMSSLKEE